MGKGRENPERRRRAWRAFAVLTPPIALAVVACLPDLRARPAPGPDSGVALPLFACGDGVIETLEDGGDTGESCDPGDAQVAGCERCAFACTGEIDDAGHCYFLADDQTSFASAGSACARVQAHLVTIASVREATFATMAARNAEFWVGLSIDPQTEGTEAGSPYATFDQVEPGWPRGGTNECVGCFALGADDAGRFQPLPGESPSPNPNRACLVAQDGGWREVPCAGGPGYATVCEREPVGRRAFFCGGPYCTTLPATAGRKRYVFGSPGTAEEARRFCESYDGGRLAVLDSADERAQLVREVVGRFPPPLTVWIGLARTGSSWTWDDDKGENERPLIWGYEQPNASSGKRAFLRIDPRRFDTQLGANDDGLAEGTPRLVACERPVP